jgi:hypothetical protein
MHLPTIFWRNNKNMLDVAFDLCAALAFVLRQIYQLSAEGERGLIFLKTMIGTALSVPG